MSHDLEIRADGTGAAAYAYKPAWHGLGVVVDGLMSAEECLQRVPELASDIVPQPVYIDAGDGHLIPIEGYVANVREKDNKPLAVVGERYKILQNSQALSFLDDLVDSGEAKYEAVISLKGGAKVSLLARLPREVKIGGMEELSTYILLSNSHDGSSAITLAATPVRVVCQNTLSLALSTAKRQFKVRHTSSLSGRLSEARTALGVVFNYMAEFEETADRLLNTPFSDAEFEQFLSSLVAMPEEDGRGKTVATNTQDTIRSIAYNNLRVADGKRNVAVNLPDMEPIKNTKWWALNSVSTYNQHFATSKKTKRTSAEENRFRRVMGDGNATIADKAFSLLTAV